MCQVKGCRYKCPVSAQPWAKDFSCIYMDKCDFHGNSEVTAHWSHQEVTEAIRCIVLTSIGLVWKQQISLFVNNLAILVNILEEKTLWGKNKVITKGCFCIKYSLNKKPVLSQFCWLHFKNDSDSSFIWSHSFVW